MNNIFNKIKKVFIGHYLKEKFNRLFDFLNDRTITIKIDESKKIIFSDIGKASGLRSRSILYKEKSTIKWIDSFEENSLFFDIGASVGTFTLYSAIKKNCNVISIEPSARNFAILNLNIYRNSLNHKVIAFPFVASYKNDLDFFYKTKVSMDESGGYPYKDIDPRGLKANSKFKQGVIYYKIDDLSKKFDYPNYIKIDVDGNELELIKGMGQILISNKVKSIMIELNENIKHYDEVIKIMEYNEFVLDKNLTSIADVSTKKGGKIYNHYFFKNHLVKL